MKKLLLFLFISTIGFSQTIYKGNISDNGMALPGVTVCVVNTHNCVSTDFYGNYAIEVKVGDVLSISYIGMKTKLIRITNLALQKNGESVNPITSSDYTEKLKKPSDSVKIAAPSGRFEFNLEDGLGDKNILKITRNENGFYSLKKGFEYNKLSFELNQEFVYSSPIRLPKYQTTYAQGRSFNGQTVYQSPDSNEIFSWGPNVNTLSYSGNPSEYYPQGDIINKTAGNGNSLQLYDPNNFYRNSISNKYSFSSQIESPKGNFLKVNFIYKAGTISIPTARNNEITSSLKYFRNVSEHSKIETVLSYNDFENNFSNANFGVNKIIFANAVTPIHFDNKTASTLSNGLQRSYSGLENNPYYLIENNLDTNKSKTFSFNFNHKYSKESISNVVNASFQSSKISNTNGQGFYFAGNNAPNFDKRIEQFKNLTASETFTYNFFNGQFIESKIDFKYQQRQLERNYFNGFITPADFPNNSLSQNKLDVSQERIEVFYNVNGSYLIKDIFDYYGEITLKANSSFNYSSTVKNDLMTNFLASAEMRNFFDIPIWFSINYSDIKTEPSLQNNNLNFNSLQYQVNQFHQLQNNLELITPKNAIPTKEKFTNFGLYYNLNYKWNLNLNFYNKRIENLYVPIFNQDMVNWSPEVNYKQNGIEVEIERTNIYGRNLSYSFNFNFTYYKNEVTSLNSDQTKIPFAGFVDVNKNYIVGQPLGVLVGSGYLRDNNQNVIIGEDGFPIKDSQPKILGNSNPDFVIGFFNTLKYKRITLNFSFDWSQGGKIWNGTQQTLNYYGKSELTGNQRNITNYVFDGVTQSGLKNTKAVSFYDPNLPLEQNRWTRYGVEGVAEDAIEDATYIRLSSINLSYKLPYSSSFDINISFFVNNAFVVSKSKTSFTNNTMFNSIETKGLDYFNSPMMRSFGSSLTIKF
ncbi:carboxypeptidase-like protein [Flavobacterium sp. 270]|uniref:carboxypeptidase-like regulatory domain-containing protein n=1 Tax=Flavobacterium sp. 270 TaxID=2512114 RepID=UPI00106591B9|nr:carboxypeptidase-like regulatory domain-containing protein [Flavobacterium sp. 270]TDW52419.1 carboxypeptidase-like protein [Flavobacterium sp. 270]